MVDVAWSSFLAKQLIATEKQVIAPGRTVRTRHIACPAFVYPSPTQLFGKHSCPQSAPTLPPLAYLHKTTLNTMFVYNDGLYQNLTTERVLAEPLADCIAVSMVGIRSPARTQSLTSSRVNPVKNSRISASEELNGSPLMRNTLHFAAVCAPLRDIPAARF